MPLKLVQAEAVRVLGVDAAGKAGWIGIVLEDGQFEGAHVALNLGDLIWGTEPLTVIGVDIPIGSTRSGRREADQLARSYVGLRRSSVFAAPPSEVWELERYEIANRLLADGGRPKLSRQSWALVPKIREADAVARSDDRVIEIHPEVTFRAMAGEDLPPKKSWAGMACRRHVLADNGVVLPDDLGPAGRVQVDDVLDAAAAAWSARRLAYGEAVSLPDPPEQGADGNQVAIWY